MKKHDQISRRKFLRAFGASSSTLLPSLAIPGFLQAATALPASNQVLILVELAGGNDGLNTVVPTDDDRYQSLRPRIGLAKSETLALDQTTGLHPKMRGFADLWEQGDLQIVEGVGYPSPNRSHFRSIEIWNAGTGAESFDNLGWVAGAFAKRPPVNMDADGLVIGGEMGPLQGPGRYSAMRDLNRYNEALGFVENEEHPVRANQSPLQHVLDTYESAYLTGSNILAKLEKSYEKDWSIPYSDLGQQLHSVARLLDAGVTAPVMKVVQNGYDTHANQRGTHDYLLEELSLALTSFSRVIQQMGRWDDITIVTYSEFGRRAYENGSAGTDHGTAAPVFVLGGAVNGGLSGSRPSLEALEDGDLKFTTDYRQVYAGLLADLWGMKSSSFTEQGFAGLKILRQT